MATPPLLRNRWARRAAFLILALLAVAALFEAAALLARHRLSAWFAGETFRRKISEEVGRGLKVEGEFAPIRPEGWTAHTPSFDSRGRPGESIAALSAEGISGTFDPWGVFLRRWQIDLITLDHASITLRPADPAAKIPLTMKPKPWYSFILPRKVWLCRVSAPDAAIRWNLRDRPAGITGLALEVTPEGAKAWHFVGHDGSLDSPFVPPLRLAAVEAVLSKPWLELESATLTPPEKDDPGSISLSGKAGLQQDKQLHLMATIDRMPLGPWLPATWKQRVGGRVSGGLHWNAPNGTKLAGADGGTSLRIGEAVLRNVPALDVLAQLSKNPAFRELHLSTASVDGEWKDPALTLSKIELEAPGTLRLEGNVRCEGEALSGTLRLGLRAADLAWLPRKGADLFPEAPEGSPYRWAKIVLSGTLQKPGDDFSPRLRKAILLSPSTLLNVAWKTLFEGDSGKKD